MDKDFLPEIWYNRTEPDMGGECEMEAYYYNRMNKAEQSAYHAMKAGFTALASSFPVPRMEGAKLSDIFFKLRLDCPEIFYVPSFRYRYFPDSANVEMIPEYLFDKGKIKEHQAAMKARVEKLARGAKELSEKEKEIYIHDFLCQNVTYDKLKKPYSHEIIGPLGHGVGVCEGIAKSVKVLCDALGIWCIIVISGANREKGIKYRHAWNVVKLGGQYYHLDATYDNSLSGKGILRYDYLNLDDARIFRDHEPVLDVIPACPDGNGFYYREKKLSFTKAEEVEKRARQAAKKGKSLVFHWRGGYLTREQVQEFLRIFEEAASEKGKYARVGLNWSQAVLSVTFEERPQEQELLEEEELLKEVTGAQEELPVEKE